MCYICSNTSCVVIFGYTISTYVGKLKTHSIIIVRTTLWNVFNDLTIQNFKKNCLEILGTGNDQYSIDIENMFSWY